MKLLFVLLLTLLLTLPSCDTEVDVAAPVVAAPPVVEAPVQETVQDPIEIPNEVVEDVVEPEPVAEPEPEQEPEQEPEPEHILDSRQALDDVGSLWYISAHGHFEHLVKQKLVLWDKDLIAYGTGIDAEEDIVFDDPGLFLHKIHLSEPSRSSVRTAFLGDPVIQICGDTRVIMDWSNGAIQLNPSMERHQLNTTNTPIYLSSDAKTAYLFRRDSGITAVELATGAETTLLTATSVLLSAECGDTVVFSYTNAAQDTVYAALALSDGTITACPHDELRFGVEALGDLWLGAIDDRTYLLGNNRFTLPDDCTAASLLEDGRLLLYAPAPEQMTLYLYENNGRFVSRCTLPEGYHGPNSDPVWVEADGGYYLLAIHPDGHDVLLFWDLSAAVAGEDLPMNPIPAKE